MIKLDVVDFSERRSEEVISFFWRSVYNDTKKNVQSTHDFDYNRSICTLQ